MNKTLKFYPEFIESIKKLDQLITPRLFDDKNLSVGDVLDLLNSKTGEKFATGKIAEIRETTFEDMVKEAADKQGMYEMYGDYYKRKIGPDDQVKMIVFERGLRLY